MLSMKKISKIFFIIVFIVIGIYHFISHYYKPDPRFIQFSPYGLKALICYEFGNYRDASKAWRAHYGLSYEYNLIEGIKETLTGQIKENPNKIENYLLLADLLFFAEDYPNAIATYRKALQKDGDAYDAKVGLASGLLAQGNYQESLSVFDDLFNQSADERSITTFLNFLVALNRLEKANMSNKEDFYLTLAYAYRYLGIIDNRKYKKVIIFSDKAIVANKNIDRAFFCKGVVYTKEKKYDMGLEQFSKALEVNPSNAEAYERMADIYGEVGNLEKELECYKKAVEIQENKPGYAFRLGDVLLRKYGDMKQANFYLKKAYELDSNDYSYASRYGFTLEMLGRFDEAIHVYDNIIQKQPENPHGYTLKADCFIRMKRYEEAIHFFLKAKEIYPLSFNDARDLALAYAEVKNFEDAISIDQYALRIKPYDVDTLYHLHYLYRRLGRNEDAYRAVVEILRIQPNHSGAQRALPYLQMNLRTRKSS
jgi:tetratricopeptide (TPR) repeat protein